MGIFVSQYGNICFPVWEYLFPSEGIILSQYGNSPLTIRLTYAEIICSEATKSQHRHQPASQQQ
jgi:hypothetical protein